MNYIHSLSSNSNIIIVRDLNLPDVNWDTYTGISSFTQDFCEAVFDLNLLQLVNKPTHRKGNILDVILTNQANITNVSTLSDLPCGLKSDHFIITCDIISRPTHEDTKNHKSYPIYNFDKANWEVMNEYLTNFDFIIVLMSTFYENFSSQLFSTVSIFLSPKFFISLIPIKFGSHLRLNTS